MGALSPVSTSQVAIARTNQDPARRGDWRGRGAAGRRWFGAAAVFGAIVLFAAACTKEDPVVASVKAFCTGAEALQKKFESKGAAPTNAEAAEFIRNLAKSAPKEIAEEVGLVADSYAARGTGDQSKLTAENQDLWEEAAHTVDEYQAENCVATGTLSEKTTTSGNGGEGGAGDGRASTTEPSKAAELTAPPEGATVAGETPCPAADGSSPRTTTFAEQPPLCIDAKKTYTATFDTTKGSFVATLDPINAPQTTNNFVVLARYHFYDGVPFHRIVPGFVVQAGDPFGPDFGTHGPGYSIVEEPPADQTYEPYDLAMAKTQAPNSTGSQFFIVTGDPTSLNAIATYSLFGKVTEGMPVVDELGAIPSVGTDNRPTEAVVINSVTITEK